MHSVQVLTAGRSPGDPEEDTGPFHGSAPSFNQLHGDNKGVPLTRTRLLSLGILLAAGLLPAQVVVLEDVNLIDGTGRPTRAHQSLVLRDGKIDGIYAANQVPQSLQSAEHVNVAGKTVMPGIINAHGHLGQTNGASSGAQFFTEQNVERQAEQYLHYGVTTMVSLGLNKDWLYDWRQPADSNAPGRVAILSAGRGIGVKGGVPPLKVDPDQVYRPANEAEARAAVREMAAHHPDLIKLWVDDGGGKLPKPDPAVERAAIDEAHKLKLRVAAHVIYGADAQYLVDAGVDILAHSVRDAVVSDTLISSMKQHGTFYIPTLALEDAFFIYATHPAWMNSPFFLNALQPELKDDLFSADRAVRTREDPSTPVHEKNLKIAKQNVKKLWDAGISVGFGTDSGAFPQRIPGFAEHRELALLVEAGLTPLQAIQSATANNARLLKIDQRVGTLEKGKQADLLVLTLDPGASIANTATIESVWQKGRKVYTAPADQVNHPLTWDTSASAKP